MHDSISVQKIKLHSFTCESSQPMSRTTKEHLTYGDLMSYPGSKKHRTKASIRVPRLFNHTHSNNMIN
jgi:hypothetical protein